MIDFHTIPAAAEAVFLSAPSYYRLAQQGLLPPPVRLTPNRSVVPVTEIEAVKAARLAGASDAEIKTLVRQMVEQRKGVTA